MANGDVIKVENGRLIMDVAITPGTPSGSGKSLVFFSTNGNREINEGYVIGVNLYKKRTH